MSRGGRFAALAASALVSLGFAALIGTTNLAGATGFRGVYFGTKCLLHGCDPYQVNQLTRFYEIEGQELPAKASDRETLIRYVNLPTTFLIVVPFALLPWKAAVFFWVGLTVSLFLLSVFAIEHIGARASPGTSLILTCILLLNCEVLFATSNTAGLAVGVCVIAVYCLTQKRYALLGIACLAVGLAVKPHDVGFIWLYFVLAGGPDRKRALKALGITSILAVIAFIWTSIAAPHWIPEMTANLTQINGPGGLNEPGPNSLTGSTAAMVIDLQAAISVFRDDPSFYTVVTYFVCGVLLLLWGIRTLRRPNSGDSSWFALSPVAAITLLITYHRPYDAKLLIVTIPACALLWSRGGYLGKVALAITTLGILMTSDITLAISLEIARKLHIAPVTFQGKVLTVLFTRPASLVLLLNAVFYLCVYLQEPNGLGERDKIPTTPANEIRQAS